jgi:hypothetical protein
VLICNFEVLFCSLMVLLQKCDLSIKIAFFGRAPAGAYLFVGLHQTPSKPCLDPCLVLCFSYFKKRVVAKKLPVAGNGLKYHCVCGNYYFFYEFYMYIFAQLCRLLTTIFHFMLVFIESN